MLGISAASPFFVTEPASSSQVIQESAIPPFSGLTNMFEVVGMGNIDKAEFPLDFVGKPSERGVVSVMPNHGHVPAMRAKVPDGIVDIPSYTIGTSLEWPDDHMLVKSTTNELMCIKKKFFNKLKHTPVDPLTLIENNWIEKIETDGWHTVLAAGVERNIAFVGSEFNKSYVSKMKVVMRRNGMGNSTSVRRNRLTDLYIDDKLFESLNIQPGYSEYNIRLWPNTKLRLDGEYPHFMEKYLHASIPHKAKHVVVGIDRSKQHFVMPFWNYNIKRKTTKDKLNQIDMVSQQGMAILDNHSVVIGYVT